MDKISLKSVLKKIAYIVVRENLTSSLVKSQVIDVLENVSCQGDQQIILVWFYRVDYLFKSNVRIRILRRSLSLRGVRLVTIPFISGRFPVSWWQIPFVLPQWLIGLMWVYVVMKVRLFHCRSYHAALAAYVFGLIGSTRFLFDPRSPFPEENVSGGRWQPNSKNFKFWKKAENRICKAAFTTIAVTPAFADKLINIAGNQKIHVIPNNYPKNYCINNPIGHYTTVSDEADIKICYIGSMGHWNNPKIYIQFLKRFLPLSKKSVSVLFAVPKESRNALFQALYKSKLSMDKICVETLDQKDVCDVIKSFTIGLYLMSQPDERLGVKFVEYLAAGLPVVVSENIKGAADFVRTKNVGLVLDKEMNNIKVVLEFVKKVIHDRYNWNRKCKKIALAEFSPKTISEKLITLYIEAGINAQISK